MAEEQLPCEEAVFSDLPRHCDRDVAISSRSEPGVTYTTNAFKMTCTCQDFIKRRQSRALYSASRMCKHLVSCLYDCCATDKSISIVSRAILEYAAKWGMPQCFGQIETSLGPVIVFYNQGSAWMNVIAPYEHDPRNGGETTAFGFNVEDMRWAYEESPQNADEISALLLGRVRRRY